MFVKSLFVFSAVAFAGSALAQPVRAPTGNWNVNFDDAQCIAHRDYGSPANPLRLALKAPAVGDVVQLAVFRLARATPPEQVEATVTVDGRQPVKTDLLMYTSKGSRERAYLLNLPSVEFASVRQAKTLSVRSSGLNETFALSRLEAVLKVVDECVADLRRVFNIGPSGADPVGLKSRAKTNLARLFSDSDYPAVAIMKGQSGKVGFAVLVGEDGRVADCTIVSTSGVPSLDSQACALLRIRARFEPARGNDGKPAKDALVGRIVWRMQQ